MLSLLPTLSPIMAKQRKSIGQSQMVCNILRALHILPSRHPSFPTKTLNLLLSGIFINFSKCYHCLFSQNSQVHWSYPTSHTLRTFNIKCPHHVLKYSSRNRKCPLSLITCGALLQLGKYFCEKYCSAFFRFPPLKFVQILLLMHSLLRNQLFW